MAINCKSTCNKCGNIIPFPVYYRADIYGGVNANYELFADSDAKVAYYSARAMSMWSAPGKVYDANNLLPN
jgi:hypothetical protein